MSTILALFALPIGWMIYRFDKKNRAAAQALFRAFIDEVEDDDALTLQEKVDKIDAMYYANGYRRVAKDASTLSVEKKEANIGIAIMAFGALNYIGLLLFFGYYFLIERPTCIEIDLEAH